MTNNMTRLERARRVLANDDGKWKIRITVGHLITAFRAIGEAHASPSRKIARIVKTHSNGAYPIPVAYLELECGHSAGAIVRSTDYALAHDNANHIAQPGALIGCTYCRHYADKIAQLRALKPGDVKHSRFRHHDSRGFGPGALYVYAWDDHSPTRARLLLSIDDTQEARDLLATLSASALSPTERA